MTEHELHICRYRNGEPCDWLVLQESLVKIKQMDEVIWEGQAHELCALIEHLRSEDARMKAKIKRLEAVKAAAIKVVAQTTAERSYQLHDVLIEALDALELGKNDDSNRNQHGRGEGGGD